MIIESKYCSDMMKHHFNKEKKHEDFESSFKY